MVSNHMKKCAKSLAVEERQIKNTIRNHYTPVRMVKIRIDNTKCWWGCRATEFLIKRRYDRIIMIETDQ